MADSAPQVQYRKETVRGFEQRKSMLGDTLTNEMVVKGNTATFLVADSGGATAVTRGINGRIPGRADNLTQTSATLVEWHDKVVKTAFNIFISQGDQRAVMQQTSIGVINRKIDTDIIAMFDAGVSQTTGATATASVDMVMHAKSILSNQFVTGGSNIFGYISPAFEAYLMQAKEFSQAQYVSNKPFENPPDWADEPTRFRWLGVNWIVCPLLTGKATASELCYMYHRSSAGHAFDRSNIQSEIDYNKEDDYSYARTTVFMGNAMLQAAGAVLMTHDGSAYA